MGKGAICFKKPRGESVLLLLLFLFALSPFNKGGYILMGVLAPILVVFNRDIRVTLVSVFLVLFSIMNYSFYVFHFESGIVELCNYLVAPWGAYFLGDLYVRFSERKRPLLALLLVLSSGFFLHGALNLFAQMFIVDIPFDGGRMAYDVWHADFVSTTGIGMLFTFAVGVAFGALLSNVPLRYKALSVLAIVVSIVYSGEVAHRTTVVLIAILGCVSVFMWMRNQANGSKKLLFILILALVLIAVAVAWETNFLGFETRVSEEWLYQRLTNAEASQSGSRSAIWLSFFEEFLFHPLGGSGFPLAYGSSYVHNMWLDVYYLTGVFAFVPMLIASVLVLLQIGAVCSRACVRIDALTKNVLLCFSLSFLCNASVEPVILVNPYIFSAFLIVAGGVSGVLLKSGFADKRTGAESE